MRELRLSRRFVATPAFVASKLIGKSTQFPREHTARYAASLQPIAPRLLQQRLNIGGAQMKITDFSKYRGKRALVLIGTDDVDHPRELDVRIADWLNENGAKADFWFLGDRGVSGNGHMIDDREQQRCRGKTGPVLGPGGVTGDLRRACLS